jgi:hypothetical protein
MDPGDKPRDDSRALCGDLVYTIHRDGDDKLHVYRHGPALDREPALLVLEEPHSVRTLK